MPIATPAPAQPLGQGPQIGQILLLLLYLALIFAGAYFVTKYFGRAMQRSSIFSTRLGARPALGKHIRLVDRLMLNRETSIVLIEADGKRYLVGVSESAFTLLETNEAPAQEVAEAEPRRTATFGDVLANWKKREEDDHA